MSYVVKVTAYLDQNGFPVSSVNHAHHFETKSLAETAALITEGTVKEVKRVITPIKKPKSKNKVQDKVEKKHQKMANQGWMNND